MLHLDLGAADVPNVFLNLARLFAPTQTLLLVPGTPDPPPLSSILSLFLAHIRDPVIVQVAGPGHGTGIATDKRHPAALTVLSPLLILRDHPLWCTERFAFVPSPAAPRAADWDACLWQVQLETFGAAATNGPILVGWRWDTEPRPSEPALPLPPLMVSYASFSNPEVRMSANRSSLPFAASYMPDIVSRRACSQISGSKYSVRSGAAGVAAVWEHALGAKVQRRYASYMKYAESGRTARSSLCSYIISIMLYIVGVDTVSNSDKLTRLACLERRNPSLLFNMVSQYCISYQDCPEVLTHETLV